MTAIEYLQRCILNFTFDPEALTIETPLKSELTLSGCGWDEGHEWYSIFPAAKLLAEVERCLREKIGKSRITVAGKQLDFPIELDGPCGGRSSNLGMERSVTAELEIEIDRKRITIHVWCPA